MMRWLKFGAFLAVILLLCIGGNISAQVEAESDSIVIAFYVASGGGWANGYAAQVTKELRQLGIDVIFSEFEDHTDVEISLLDRYDDNGNRAGTFMYFHLRSQPFAQLSPIVSDFLDPNNPRIDFRIRVADHIYGPQGAVLFTKALALYAVERCDLALPFFTALTLRLPTQRGSFLGRQNAVNGFYGGNCAAILGDYDLAIQFYETALFDSDGIYYPSTVANLAWTYLQLAREDDAFALVTSAIEDSESRRLNPSTLYVTRAQLYALAFRYDEAIADMDAAIELDPDNPELYVLRANITLLIYEWDRVLADYNTAIELDPDYADAYFYRGVFYYTRTEYQLALDDLNRYLELAPDGIHATDATTYIEEINVTLNALGD